MVNPYKRKLNEIRIKQKRHKQLMWPATNNQAHCPVFEDKSSNGDSNPALALDPFD